MKKKFFKVEEVLDEIYEILEKLESLEKSHSAVVDKYNSEQHKLKIAMAKKNVELVISCGKNFHELGEQK